MRKWGLWKWWLRRREMEMELRAVAVGVNSTVSMEDDLHVVMLDFDVDAYEKVVESVRELQDFWGLADAYVYETRNGFHVLFYEDVVPYERCRMIIDFAKYVDPLFKYVSRYHDHKTLRVAGKHVGQDIVLRSVIPGVRVPSVEEREWGVLKRREHQSMLASVGLSESSE